MEQTITIIHRPSHFLFPGRHGSSNSIRRPSARASSHHVYCYVCHKSRIRGLVLVVAVRGAVAFVVVDAVRGAVGFVVTVAHGGAVAFVVAVAVGGTMGLVVAVTVGGTMGFVCTLNILLDVLLGVTLNFPLADARAACRSSRSLS